MLLCSGSESFPPRKAASTLVAMLALASLEVGCAPRAMVIRTSPESARVYIDGKELHGNSFEYGRWVGNEYRMKVEAPGYQSEERVLDVHVSNWAVLVVGPLWWPWMGELPTQIYVELQRSKPPPPALAFEEAVRHLTNDLLVQVNNHREKAQKPSQTNLVSDPVVDADTGEVFEVSRRIEELMEDEARLKFPSFALSEMNSQNIERADYVITGIIPLEPYYDDGGKLRHLSMSALDRHTGVIVANADVWLTTTDLEFDLTPMYRDSPMYLKDKRVEALIATAKATAGSLADDEYFNSLTTNALLDEASSAYNRGDHLLALGLFAKAAERSDGQVMRTFSGLYQSFFKLQRTDEAGQAFASLVALGMQRGNLGVKFLFNVDATEFFGQPDDLEQYQIWLREIGKVIVASKSCTQIVGHASHTGAEEYNLDLSLKRAELIYDRLETEAPGVDKKATAIGRGFSENIIGTGADDATDAIDRRVEFKISPCSS